MNPLYVNRLSQDYSRESLLKEGTVLTLDRINWPEYPYKPHVVVYLGWNESTLHLLFQVEEKSFQANVLENNGMVCNDSCVEFFFQDNHSQNYFNLEVNGIGTIHLKNGSHRENRSALPEEIMNMIQIQSALERRLYPLSNKKTSWELGVSLPLGSLFDGEITSAGDLSSLVLKGNFYKCGDELSPPHYVSWAPVKTEKPDFHSPAYFREIHFRR